MNSKSLLPACALAAASTLITGCLVADPARSVTVREEAYTPGYVVTTLPPGYTVRRYNNDEYYVANDVYYRRGPRGYTVVDPPFPAARVTTYRTGHVTSTLPAGHSVRRHRGRDYYVANDVWFRPHRRGYVVVNTPR